MADSDSTPGRAPAFQFYPNDFLSDRNVVVMSMQERGVYITLICHAWQSPLPSDVAQLARICGVPLSSFRKLWPALSICFREQDGFLVHPRLERERAKQAEYRTERSESGRRGASKRWLSHGSPIAKPSGADGRATSEPIAKPMANDGSCLISTQSSSLSQTQTPLTVVVGKADARSKRPIFTGQRITVFEWMLDDLYRLLGRETADALDMHEWFYALDAQVASSAEVIPQRDGGRWLQERTLAEAQRRGLITEPEHKSKLTKALEKASDW